MKNPQTPIRKSKEIGRKVRARRKELGVTQEMLAELLGVTYQQVQRYENGTNKLNVENIQLIANLLSVPTSYFFKSEEAVQLTPEEKKLLGYYRKIKDREPRNVVMKVARLAAKTL